VVCVDEDPEFFEFLMSTFQQTGYEVRRAEGRDQALDVVRTHHPDLLCLGALTAGEDGPATLAGLHEDPALASVPVIAVSASVEEARALGTRVRRYLSKPVSPDMVLEAVREALVDDLGSVLIVDDDRVTQKLLAATLQRQGIKVSCAANGEEALTHLRNAVPDVIVLDLMMPVMDGVEFLEQAHQDPVWCGIPVVVITAKAVTHETVCALSRTCTAIAAKGRDEAVRLIGGIMRAQSRKSRASSVGSELPALEAPT
jgi:CheY-like chemotaxis protein